MSAGLSLFVAVIVSLGLSAILVYVLAAPLRRVLNAVCTAETTQFWVSFTAVMLFIAPLLFSVFAASPEGGLAGVHVIRTTLLASLLGATCALLIVGLNLNGAQRRSGGGASR